jgi:hypothetical protein
MRDGLGADWTYKSYRFDNLNTPGVHKKLGITPTEFLRRQGFSEDMSSEKMKRHGMMNDDGMSSMISPERPDFGLGVDLAMSTPQHSQEKLNNRQQQQIIQQSFEPLARRHARQQFISLDELPIGPKI